MFRRLFFATAVLAVLAGTGRSQDFDPFRGTALADNPAQRQVVEMRRMRQAQENAAVQSYAAQANASRENSQSSRLVFGGIIAAAVVIAGAIVYRKS